MGFDYLETLFFGAVLVLSWLSAFPFRRRRQLELKAGVKATPGSSQHVPLWRLIGSVIAFSAFVILFTHTLMWVTRAYPGTVLAAGPRMIHLKGWFLFWGVFLLFRSIECAFRVYYNRRQRRFPIPGLLFAILKSLFAITTVAAVANLVYGFNVTLFLTSTAVLTAVIGYALKEVLGDFLAGISLQMTRSIVPSHFIAMENGLEGEIIETNWRETRIRTNAGHIYIVPHSTIARSNIHLMTWPNAMRRHSIYITLSAAASPEQVKKLIIEAALAHPKVVPEPKPSVLLKQFREFGIEYHLRFWSESLYDRFQMESKISEHIWYALKRHRIDIPLPIGGGMLFNLLGQERRGDDEYRDSTLRTFMNSRFVKQILTDSENRPLLTEEQLHHFSGLLRRVYYGGGERIFAQGEEGDSCFIVQKGLLSGRIHYEDAQATSEQTFQLGPGSLVGEMSLITGLPRTATVVAIEEVELIEISQESFIKLLAMNDTIPRILSDMAAQRAQGNIEEWQRLKSMQKGVVEKRLNRHNILGRLLGLMGNRRGGATTARPPLG